MIIRGNGERISVEMKIDRLLSIIIYLLNRELVPARELAERYGVTVRTIQRDMQAIELAGIPILSVQGPNGGYGIMSGYRMDRRFFSPDDLFYIITALSSIGGPISERKISNTVEKMKGLLSEREGAGFEEKHRRLYVDFSLLNGGERSKEIFSLVEKAIDEQRLLEIRYTSNKLKESTRVLEPMTIVFKWRSWYLFAFCRLREDYRLFRMSRLKEPRLLDSRFKRRETAVEGFLQKSEHSWSEGSIDLVLAFHPKMGPLVEDFFRDQETERDDEGRCIVRMSMPEDEWVYGMILSYGNYVEVLSPQRIRQKIIEIAEKIKKTYTTTT